MFLCPYQIYLLTEAGRLYTFWADWVREFYWWDPDSSNLLCTDASPQDFTEVVPARKLALQALVQIDDLR